MVAVALRHRAIIPHQVALRIGRQEAHPSRAGIFKTGIQPVGRLAHARRADHKHMDVPGVHQSGRLFTFAHTADYDALRQFRRRSRLSQRPPSLRRKGYSAVSASDLRLGRPSGCSMLAVTYGFGFNAVQAVILCQQGNADQHADHDACGQQ